MTDKARLLPQSVESVVTPPRAAHGSRSLASAARAGQSGAINVVKYNSTGDYILFGGQDRDIWLANTRTLNFVQTFSGGHGREILDISLAADNTRFASCGGDRFACLWDISEGTVIRKFDGHEQRVNCLEFNADASLLVTGSYDTTARIWDCRSWSRTPLQVLNQAKDSVMAIHITKTEILTGSVDGYFRTYDIRKGQLTSDYLGSPVTSLQVTGDGNCVLASTLDNTIRLMDNADGSMLNKYTGHENKQYRIQSHLDSEDAFILSGSEDGSIFIWDMLTASVQRNLRHHRHVVTSVSFHPRGLDRLVSASADGTVLLWAGASANQAQS